MSKNEMSKKENYRCVADVVESFNMSYHTGKALEDMLQMEIAESRDRAEKLARMAKDCIDRYVAFQWKGM